MSKYTSAMELLNCLWKTDFDKLGISHSAKELLSILLTYVNFEKLENGVGYVSWPNSDTIMQKCGLKNTALNTAKKELKDQEFIRFHQGKGPKNSNDYYINGFKIVMLYKQSGNEGDVSGKIAPFPEVEGKKQKNLNTKGLVQNQGTATPVASEQPKKETTRQEVPKVVECDTKPNADGSPMYFSNGARRYSWNDVMPKLDEEDNGPPISHSEPEPDYKEVGF